MHVGVTIWNANPSIDHEMARLASTYRLQQQIATPTSARLKLEQELAPETQTRARTPAPTRLATPPLPAVLDTNMSHRPLSLTEPKSFLTSQKMADAGPPPPVKEHSTPRRPQSARSGSGSGRRPKIASGTAPKGKPPSHSLPSLEQLAKDLNIKTQRSRSSRISADEKRRKMLQDALEAKAREDPMNIPVTFAHFYNVSNRSNGMPIRRTDAQRANTGHEPVTVWGSMRVQGHQSYTDGCLYLTNLQHLLPPQPPVCLSVNRKRAILARLANSLSSDSYPKTSDINSNGKVSEAYARATEKHRQRLLEVLKDTMMLEYLEPSPQPIERESFVFRPEFLRDGLSRKFWHELPPWAPEGLSADAFTCYEKMSRASKLKINSDAAPHNKASTKNVFLINAYLNRFVARKALSFLLKHILPRTAAEVDNIFYNQSSKRHAPLSRSPSFHDKVINTLHHRGINLRFLGILRMYLTSEKAREVVLEEMLARVLKVRFRQLLRQLFNLMSTNDVAVQGARAYAKCSQRFFALVFGTNRASDEVWRNLLPVHLFRKYYSGFLNLSDSASDIVEVSADDLELDEEAQLLWDTLTTELVEVRSWAQTTAPGMSGYTEASISNHMDVREWRRDRFTAQLLRSLEVSLASNEQWDRWERIQSKIEDRGNGSEVYGTWPRDLWNPQLEAVAEDSIEHSGRSAPKHAAKLCFVPLEIDPGVTFEYLQEMLRPKYTGRWHVGVKVKTALPRSLLISSRRYRSAASAADSGLLGSSSQSGGLKGGDVAVMDVRPSAMPRVLEAFGSLRRNPRAMFFNTSSKRSAVAAAMPLTAIEVCSRQLEIRTSLLGPHDPTLLPLLRAMVGHYVYCILLQKGGGQPRTHRNHFLGLEEEQTHSHHVDVFQESEYSNASSRSITRGSKSSTSVSHSVDGVLSALAKLKAVRKVLSMTRTESSISSSAKKLPNISGSFLRGSFLDTSWNSLARSAQSAEYRSGSSSVASTESLARLPSETRLSDRVPEYNPEGEFTMDTGTANILDNLFLSTRRSETSVGNPSRAMISDKEVCQGCGLKRGSVSVCECKQHLHDLMESINAIYRAQAGISYKDLTRNGIVSECFEKLLDAQKFYRAGLDACIKQHGTITVETAYCSTNLARIHVRLGQTSYAIPLYNHALIIYKHVQGERDPQVAFVRTQLAQLAADTGNWEESERHLRETLLLVNHHFGADHYHTGPALVNLGKLYLARRPPAEERAERVLLKARHIMEAAIGSSDSRLLDVLEVLGKMYACFGDWTKAQSTLEQLERIQMDTFGPESLEVASTCRDIAHGIWNTLPEAPANKWTIKYNSRLPLQQASGSSADGRPVLQQVVAPVQFERTIFSGSHPEIRTGSSSIPRRLSDVYRFNDAEIERVIFERFRCVLRLRKKHLVANNPLICSSLADLARFQASAVTGDRESALKSFKKALEMAEALYGDESFEVGSLCHEIGSLSASMELYDPGTQWLARALVIHRKASGQADVGCLPILIKLAHTATALGESEAGEQFLKDALSVAEFQLGASHPQVAEIVELLNNLSRAKNSDRLPTTPLFARALALSSQTLAQELSRFANNINSIDNPDGTGAPNSRKTNMFLAGETDKRKNHGAHLFKEMTEGPPSDRSPGLRMPDPNSEQSHLKFSLPMTTESLVGHAGSRVSEQDGNRVQPRNQLSTRSLKRTIAQNEIDAILRDLCQPRNSHLDVLTAVEGSAVPSSSTTYSENDVKLPFDLQDLKTPVTENCRQGSQTEEADALLKSLEHQTTIKPELDYKQQSDEMIQDLQKEWTHNLGQLFVSSYLSDP